MPSWGRPGVHDVGKALDVEGGEQVGAEVAQCGGESVGPPLPEGPLPACRLGDEDARLREEALGGRLVGRREKPEDVAPQDRDGVLPRRHLDAVPDGPVEHVLEGGGEDPRGRRRRVREEGVHEGIEPGVRRLGGEAGERLHLGRARGPRGRKSVLELGCGASAAGPAGCRPGQRHRSRRAAARLADHQVRGQGEGRRGGRAAHEVGEDAQRRGTLLAEGHAGRGERRRGEPAFGDVVETRDRQVGRHAEPARLNRPERLEREQVARRDDRIQTGARAQTPAVDEDLDRLGARVPRERRRNERFVERDAVRGQLVAVGAEPVAGRGVGGRSPHEGDAPVPVDRQQVVHDLPHALVRIEQHGRRPQHLLRQADERHSAEPLVEPLHLGRLRAAAEARDPAHDAVEALRAGEVVHAAHGGPVGIGEPAAREAEEIHAAAPRLVRDRRPQRTARTGVEVREQQADRREPVGCPERPLGDVAHGPAGGFSGGTPTGRPVRALSTMASATASE